jgi:hypothetical protein
MKNFHVGIDFDEVLKRIEKEMEGYSRTEWANKVGVRINVVSNIHGANARQNPSLNYILAVSVATRKTDGLLFMGPGILPTVRSSGYDGQRGCKNISGCP